MVLLSRACGALERALTAVAIVALATISVSLVVQVVLRYFFNQPSVWSEELATLCFVWLVMMSIPVALRQHEHIALEFLLVRLPSVVRAVMDKIITLLVLATFAFVGYLSLILLPLASRQQLTGLSLMGGFEVSLSAMYVAAPIGCACAVVFCVENLVRGHWQTATPEVHEEPSTSGGAA